MKSKSRITIFSVLFCCIFLFSNLSSQENSVHKKTIDFKSVKITKLGNTSILYDTSGTKPIQLCPLATIDYVEEINKEYNYALVFCLNKHFIINKYGEMSFGYNIDGSYYDPINNTILCSRTKNRLKKGLYSFTGKEIISPNKYKINSHTNFSNGESTFYIVENKQKQKGIINHDGKLILDCIYDEIVFTSQYQVELKQKKQKDKVYNLKQ